MAIGESILGGNADRIAGSWDTCARRCSCAGAVRCVLRISLESGQLQECGIGRKELGRLGTKECDRQEESGGNAASNQ